VKFYLDEDLSPRIAERLRRRNIDTISAHEVGNVQLSDREQLAFAAGEGRCFVTRNARHFAVLAVEAVRVQRPHAGIVICPPSLLGSEIRTITERLARIARQYPEGLGPYDVIYL
jgi:predicted nuclease of predicted toxin-antitoxin system